MSSSLDRAAMRCVSLGALLVAAAALPAHAQLQQPVVSPAATLKWDDNPALAGARIAVLWGDPKVGAYGALKSLPAGGVLPLHTHTSSSRAIVMSGTMMLSVEGVAAKELGAGSYAFIPGGVKHKAECRGGARCVYFEEQTGPSDFRAAVPTPPAPKKP